MRTKEYTLTGFAADDNGLVTTDQPAAGVALTLEAAAAALSPPREVTITSAADVSGADFVVVGTDRWGNAITETIAGPDNTTVTGRKVFASITSITPSASVAQDITIGWPARTVSPWVACGRRVGSELLPTALVSMLATVGAGDGIVEVTFDSNQSPAKASYPHIFEAAEQKGEDLTIDETIAVTPGTPVEAQGIMCRAVLTSGASTAAKARFAIPGP